MVTLLGRPALFSQTRHLPGNLTTDVGVREISTVVQIIRGRHHGELPGANICSVLSDVPTELTGG